jgi:hypothetical protein
MMRRRPALAAIVIAFVAIAGCDGDPARPKKKAVPSGYNNLTEKVDVLHNLQQAMNDMNVARYVEVLDPDQFTFFFSPGDVGGSVPESWGFSADSVCATHMLGGGGGVTNNAILDISLELVDFENATWVEFNPIDYPGWFEATVIYAFHMETEQDRTYITSGVPRAQIRIKQDGGGKWRIVQWNDIAYQRAALSSGPAGTEESSWGGVKALYGP